MNPIRTVVVGVATLSLLLFCTQVSGTGQILRVSDGAVMSLSEVVEDLKQTRIVFVGELHNNRTHHAVQLEVIRALKEANVPVAIGLEMFQRRSQAELDRWIQGKLSEREFQKIYYRNWNFPWKLYRNIFTYAKDGRIPMIGLNVPPEITRQVAREGFASLSPEQREDLGVVSCRVDPEYQAFIRRSLGMHGHGGMTFRNFCEAQMVWDTAMALNVLRFLDENPDFVVVVVAGSGHAWKQGIPVQIRSRSALPFRVILPRIPGRVERENVTVNEADYLWLA